MNSEYIDLLEILGTAIAIVNYKENLQQSTADDVIEELNRKQSEIVNQLQLDLNKQNQLLKEILFKLETQT